MSCTIECCNIKKSYGKGDNKVVALQGIDLEVFSAQLTLLVGPSGSGKTTLLSIITSILSPDEGELFLLGKNLNRMKMKEKVLFCRDNLGIVFQSLFLIPTLTIVENVILPLLVAGVSRIIAENKALALLDLMHLGQRAQVLPTELSKGQQQRVAIARALINDAKVIVCDEPTSALDHTTGAEIMKILHTLARDSLKTVLIVTHDQRTFPFADRIVTMSDGQIISG